MCFSTDWGGISHGAEVIQTEHGNVTGCFDGVRKKKLLRLTCVCTFSNPFLSNSAQCLSPLTVHFHISVNDLDQQSPGQENMRTSVSFISHIPALILRQFDVCLGLCWSADAEFV